MAVTCTTPKTRLNNGVNICSDDVSIYSNANYDLFRQLSSNCTPIDNNTEQCDAINVQSIESCLADRTLWSKYVTIQSPGDGHCLIHSINC